MEKRTDAQKTEDGQLDIERIQKTYSGWGTTGVDVDALVAEVKRLRRSLEWIGICDNEAGICECCDLAKRALAGEAVGTSAKVNLALPKREEK